LEGCKATGDGKRAMGGERIEWARSWGTDLVEYVRERKKSRGTEQSDRVVGNRGTCGGGITIGGELVRGGAVGGRNKRPGWGTAGWQGVERRGRGGSLRALSGKRRKHDSGNGRR